MLLIISNTLYNRSSRNNITGWFEEGLAVYFSNSDLKAQGRLSSNKLFPWKRVTDSIMKIARKNRQPYIFVWFPYRFGKQANDDNSHTYQNVIQQILPTRTGYNGIKSEVVVWLSSVNFTELVNQEDVVELPWTEEDHWTHYKPVSTIEDSESPSITLKEQTNNLKNGQDF